MARGNDIGRRGEDIARRHLLDEGYEIVDTNWRFGHLEVDIIAYSEGLLVFVEVKTRSTATFGSPEEFVDRRKQRAYIRLANAYVLQHNRNEEVRFDIIGILYRENDYELTHLKGAFTTVG